MSAADAFDLELRVETLAFGEAFDLPADDRERVIVVLGGRCAAFFPASCRIWHGLGARDDVFDGPATALYAPRGEAGLIVGEEGGVRLAVVSAVAAAEHDRNSYVVRPEEVRIEHRGRDSWSRVVHDVVGPDQPADRLIVGETFSIGGVWSGYPPHRHDRDDPPHEARLDEMFLIQVHPPSGFGVLLRSSEDGERERAEVVRDGDIIRVAEGYHSFAAAGGHRFYYLWALAGDERVLRPRTDPRHAWLLEAPVEDETADHVDPPRPAGADRP